MFIHDADYQIENVKFSDMWSETIEGDVLTYGTIDNPMRFHTNYKRLFIFNEGSFTYIVLDFPYHKDNKLKKYIYNYLRQNLSSSIEPTTFEFGLNLKQKQLEGIPRKTYKFIDNEKREAQIINPHFIRNKKYPNLPTISGEIEVLGKKYPFEITGIEDDDMSIKTSLKNDDYESFLLAFVGSTLSFEYDNVLKIKILMR